MIKDKNLEKNAKTSLNSAKNIEKIVKIKNKTQKQLSIKSKKNETRISKCNKSLQKNDKTDKEILAKINEYNTNGRKTICYFVDTYFPVIDGVVSVVDNYARFMSKYFNVVVCCPKHNKQSYKTDNYLVLSANSIFIKKQGYDYTVPKFDAYFNKYISLLKIDLVHIHSPFNMGSFGLELAKKRKIPSLSTFHSQFKKNFYSSTKSKFISNFLTHIIMKIYKSTTRTLTMNDYTLGIMKEYGLKSKKVDILPNATSLEHKDFDNEFEKEILKKYKINNDKFNMIFVGRFVEVKNVYFIIEVLKDLIVINDNFNMIFLGYGPEEKKMKELCKEYNLDNNVIFTGIVSSDDVKSVIIKHSDLFFFPSTYDNDPVVKLECACYGVPEICVKDTGASSGITDNHNGFIEDFEKDAFTNRINYLINHKELVKEVGENAFKELYIQWDEIGERLKAYYDKILDTKNLKCAKRNKD